MVNNVPSLLMFKLLFLAQTFCAGASVPQLGRIQCLKSVIRFTNLQICSIFGGKMSPSKCVNKNLQTHTFVSVSQPQNSNENLLPQISSKCLEYSAVADDSVEKQISVLATKDHIPECFSRCSLASNNKCGSTGSRA